MNDTNDVSVVVSKVPLADKMRYQPNKICYYLTFGGLVFTLIYLFGAIDLIKPVTAIIALKILFNIILFFVTFLSMEKVKAYSKGWSIFQICLGILALIRIFWAPFILKAQIDSGDELIATNFDVFLLITYLVIAAAFFISSGIIGYIKSTILTNYLKSIQEIK